MAAIQPSTWNHLGHAVATSWAGLGLLSILSPYRTAGLFCFHDSLSGDGRGDIPHAMSLVGARDLTLALAMFSLARAGRNRELGTLILSTLVICGADMYVVWKRRNKVM